MRTKRVWFLAQITPLVAGSIGLTTLPVGAVETLASTDSSASTQSIDPGTPSLEAQSEPIGVAADLRLSVIDSGDSGSIETEIITETSILQAWTNEPMEVQTVQLSEPLPNQLTTSESVVIENAQAAIADSSLHRSSPFHVEYPLPTSWQIAQTASSDETDSPTESAAEPEETPETTSESEGTSSSPQWLFTLTPYAFVPFSVDGTATIGEVTEDFNLGLDDILSPLNFAAAGRFEAWKGHLGFIFDGAYFNLGQDNSRSLAVPDCLCGILPSEIDTEVNVQYGQFDLGVGYRIADNLSKAANDFELGDLVFDAVVGVRIYALRQEIDISTNINTGRNLDESNTLITPLASGRFRWNVSPTLAGWVRGDIAGFGLDGTLLTLSVTGGVDWMFSGNTSLLLAYRLSSLNYATDVRGKDFDLNVLMHGPYMGVVFRF